jgi:hypothetical protein
MNPPLDPDWTSTSVERMLFARSLFETQAAARLKEAVTSNLFGSYNAELPCGNRSRRRAVRRGPGSMGDLEPSAQKRPGCLPGASGTFLTRLMPGYLV